MATKRAYNSGIPSRKMNMDAYSTNKPFPTLILSRIKKEMEGCR
ncbi:hypothetical protein [Desulfotruncus arcticus]|nr:hypothetical protein [Desulfotruncus arcticus]